MDMKIKAIPAIKAGRCFNGAHRDKGKIIHAVPPLPDDTSGYWGAKALCGTSPGRSSYGWDHTDQDINCPKCLKKINL